MNPLSILSYGDFCAWMDGYRQFQMAIERGGPPPPFIPTGETIEMAGARMRCFMRIADFVFLHEERFWASGFVRYSESEVLTFHPIWQATFNYFTHAEQAQDVPNPDPEMILREARRIRDEAKRNA
jgi:hypothetical protein